MISNAAKKRYTNLAIKGYEKLAFGSATDAIRLLFLEDINPKDFSTMDLFNISEIKKPKDGSMEIKFFDRLAALQKLEQISKEDEKSIFPLYKALEKNADMLKGKDND